MYSLNINITLNLEYLCDTEHFKAGQESVKEYGPMKHNIKNNTNAEAINHQEQLPPFQAVS